MTPTRDALLAGPGHPLCLAAGALILANDLVLRAFWPGWLTGKLSDVGWLVVAPVVAAALLAWFPRGERVAIALTGAFYVALQVWPPLGEALAPGHVADLGDLLVLPAMALAPLCWRGARRRRAWAVVVGAGVLVADQSDYTPEEIVTWPCGDEMGWPADQPLVFYANFNLRWESRRFQEGVRLVDSDGRDVAWVLAAGPWDRVLLCAPLEDGETYTWTVDADVPDVWPVTFTAVGDGLPLGSEEDCEAHGDALPDEVYGRCVPGLDDTASWGDTG